MSEQPKYKRVLLKLSGEALAGEKKIGLDYSVITKICESIKKCADIGVQMGIVVGGNLGGILGMLLGVPVFSVLYKLMGQIIQSKLEAKNIKLE